MKHASVFERSLNVKRPFRSGEKGYRDTLLWLSLLEYLKSKSTDTEVIFITGDKNDFYAGGQEIMFHEDLHADLDALSNVKVRPFLSIAAFVDAEIDKKEHAIDREKATPIIEEYLEEQALELFDSAELTFLHELGKAILPGTNLFDSALAVTSSLMEGIEDLDITATSELGNGDGDVYVSCEYNLRITVFEISIPSTVYNLHKAVIESSSAIFEVVANGHFVVLNTLARPYLLASFTFNRNSETCSGYSAAIIRFR